MSVPSQPTFLGISIEDIKYFFRQNKSPDFLNKSVLILIGVFLTPITVIGALVGFARVYNRFDRWRDYQPDISRLSRLAIFGMIIGAIMAWIITIAVIYLLVILIELIFGIENLKFALFYLPINLALTLLAFSLFRQWQAAFSSLASEKTKFGSARFARPDELGEFTQEGGIYIGGGYVFRDKGHFLTMAGTRGGKGTNLIIPNLLGVGQYQGSWVVIDPKGENAAITQRRQKELGQDVIVLNPWDLLKEHTGPARSFNPLDILTDKTSSHLVDDVMVISGMIVPVDASEKDRFFSDNARAIIAGLILHLINKDGDKEEKVLSTIWKWARLVGDDWDELLAEMRITDQRTINGEAVVSAANEILKLQSAGDKTFGSIMATVLQSTNFLNSPALQKAMVSDFDPYKLADGKTTIYVIIPADKLQSHARWLRLVTTTLLRAVIRKPNKRVTFLLDEFAALGYLPEIEIALSTYAGYEVSIWAVMQSLVQLQNIYQNNWESFTANTAVRLYFSVNDNFSANYISASMGNESNVCYARSWLGPRAFESNKKPLMAPDELRRSSGTFMYAFIKDRPPAQFIKLPYYEMEGLGNYYDSNPYIK